MSVNPPREEEEEDKGGVFKWTIILWFFPVLKIKALFLIVP